MRNKAIQALRKFHGTDSYGLAQSLLLPHSYIMAMEKGEESVPDSVIKKYAEFYDISESTINLLANAMANKNTLPIDMWFVTRIIEWVAKD